ncbi:alkaline phosphatase PhoX, partial [Nitrobacter vulgaris]
MSKTIEIIRGDGGDEPPCLETGNPRFGDLVARRLKRRDVLAGALATAVAALFVRPGDGRAAKDRLDFKPVPVSRADRVAVPEGYRVQFILPWGEPILGRMPAFTIDNSGEDQAMQVGSLRIPMKSPGHSEMMPPIDSDMMSPRARASLAAK